MRISADGGMATEFEDVSSGYGVYSGGGAGGSILLRAASAQVMQYAGMCFCDSLLFGEMLLIGR